MNKIKDLKRKYEANEDVLDKACVIVVAALALIVMNKQDKKHNK